MILKLLKNSIILLLLMPFCLYAQSNYKPGYIVTLKGDTIKGLINYKQWGQRNPSQVTFKGGLNSAITKYGAADIGAFGIYNYESYRALTVPLSQNTIAADDLVNFVDTTVVKKTVFLRLVVGSKKISFFVYDDSFKQRCFVAEGNSLPFELRVYRHTSTVDPTKIIEVNTYTQQLQRLASIYSPGNTTLINSIQLSQYSEQDFKKIILAINGDNEADRYVEPKRAAVRYFIGLGLNAAKTEFTGTHYYNLNGPYRSYYPQINGGIDVLLNNNVGKTIFRVEVDLSTSRAEFHYKNQDYNQNLGGLYTYEYIFKFSRVSMIVNPQLLYNFYNGDNFKAFIAGGGAIEFATYPSLHEENVTTIKGVTKVEDTDPPALNRSDFTLTAKAGVVIKSRFQLYAGYSLPTKLFEGRSFSLNINTYRFGINYLFEKK